MVPLPVLRRLFTVSGTTSVFNVSAPVNVAVPNTLTRPSVSALNEFCATPLPAVTFVAEVMVTTFNAVAPTCPVKVILPAPAANSMLCGVSILSLFSCPPNVISPEPVPVSITTSSIKVVSVVNDTLRAVTLAARKMLLAEVADKSVSGVPSPIAPVKLTSPNADTVKLNGPSIVTGARIVPKSMFPPVETKLVLPVSIVFSPINTELAVNVVSEVFRFMPEARFIERLPVIALTPVVESVTVPASTIKPPKVKLFTKAPPESVNVPVKLIGAPAPELEACNTKSVPGASAEIPAIAPPSLMVIPFNPVAVNVSVPPPRTTTTSLIVIPACVMSAPRLVVFPEPFTVKIPLPVMAPITLKSPPPPSMKFIVTLLLLVQAPSTVISPVLPVTAVGLPSNTLETDD